MNGESGFAEVNETQLFYETAGEDFPLVFIHGGLTDSHMWDDQFEYFPRHFRVIRYDARGFGQSGIPRKPFYPHKDLKALLDFLGIKKASILGLSMGGAFATDFTLEYPEMVRGLILAVPSVHGFEYSEEFLKKGLELFSINLEKGAEEATRELFEDPFWSYIVPPVHHPARNRIREMARHFFRVFRWDPSLMQAASPPAIQRLSDITVPTLLIAAGNDHPENLTVIQRLEAEIRGVEKVEINDACHMMNMERPEEFNRIVYEFLLKSVPSRY